MFERDDSVKINVTQQPNDAVDAARLYGELEDKAFARVSSILEAKTSNELSFIVFQQNLMYQQWWISFKLNGRGYTLKIDDPRESSNYLRAVAEAMVDEIFHILPKSTLNSLR